MHFWTSDEPLVLASGSATRRLLLESAGVPVIVSPADIDERKVEQPLRSAGESPAAIAAHLARAKALAVSAEQPGRIVLGADQTLALGTTLFSKPASIEAARHHLQMLSGQTHSLHSAIALVRDGNPVFETVAEARLSMRDLSAAFIEAYLQAEGAGVCSSVGAYKLEGLGVHLFERIEGDHATILGLPLLALLPALRQFGYLLS